MIGVAFSQFPPQDGSGFDLIGKKAVYPENQEGRRREVVVAVEGTEVVTLVILDGLGVFCFLGAVDASGVDRVH